MEEAQGSIAQTVETPTTQAPAEAQSQQQSAAPSQQAQQAAQQQAEYVGILDYAKSKGMTDFASRYTDDAQALDELLSYQQSLPQLQYLAQYGQEYMQNADNYQKWLQSQQQQQAPAQPQAPKGWVNPPVSRNEYEGLKSQWFEKDPVSGQERPRLGTPPSIVQKVADFEQHSREWANKLLYSPQDAFQSLKDPVTEWTKEVIRQELAQQHARNTSQQIIERHANWLFHVDPGTKIPVYGRYTPEGVMFLNFVKQAEQLGIRNPLETEQYALNLVELEILRRRHATGNGGNAAAPAQRAPVGTSPAQRVPPASDSTATTKVGGKTKLPLKNRLQQAFQAAGGLQN